MILQDLNALYEREAAAGKIVAYGTSMERVTWVLVISEKGKVVDVEDRRDGKMPAPRIAVPRPPKSTVNIAPRFLYGNSAYVLGAMTKAQTKKLPAEEAEAATVKTEKIVNRAKEEHEEWRAYHRNLLADTEDKGLCAVLKFIEGWTSHRIANLRYADELIEGTIALRLDADVHPDGSPRYVHERPVAQAIWSAQAHEEGKTSDVGICLVTGTSGPIERLHPSIKGVYDRGGRRSSASLVSYNVGAVEHFGHKSQGLNAPVSKKAAHGYVAALNARLENPQTHVRIGDATAVFWVDAAGDPAPAEALLATLLSGGTTTPGEEAETERLNETLRQIGAGRPLTEADPNLDPTSRYHVLGLMSAARGRHGIRWYLAGSLGELAQRIGEHWQDMRLEPVPWRTPPSAQWLALQTVPARPKAAGGFARDKAAINPTLPGDLLTAILTGSRYPSGLLQTIVQRLATDRDINGVRVAMVRACLARDHRLTGSERGVPPMALDPENANAAYQLGRLFAVLDRAFRAANPKSKRTLSDGHYRLASTQPAAAFPRLLATAQHHLATLRRENNGGLAYGLNKDIEGITSRIDASFPRALHTTDQGRFSIGYYHQRGGGTTSISTGDDKRD